MKSKHPSGLIKEWIGKFVRSCRRRGLAETAKYGVALIAYAISNHFPAAWIDYSERHFDRKFGVDTAGTVYLPELQTDPQYRHAHAYGTSSSFFMRRALKALPADHGNFTFIDMGCGKGKVMLVASDWPFRQIIGIDLSPSLLENAERNIAMFRGKKKGCRNFRLLRIHASAYEIPPENVVLYFFNPFEEPLMREVFENAGRTVVQYPREVFIILNFPVHRVLADSLPFLSVVRESPWYRIYKVMPGGRALRLPQPIRGGHSVQASDAD